MPFGLTNAPSVFQQGMHVVLKGLIGKICLAYLDDIIVLACTPEEPAANLDTILSHRHACMNTSSSATWRMSVCHARNKVFGPWGNG